MGALSLLGVGDDARRGGVALGDEGVALLHALANVLLVEATRELEQVVGVARVHGVHVGAEGAAAAAAAGTPGCANCGCCCG